MLKIKDFAEKVGGLEEGDRALACANLYRRFSEVTRIDLQLFQKYWDGSKPFEEFRDAQNKVFIRCLEHELSDTGIVDRKAYDLAPLDPEEVLIP